ncbi:MAG: complex I subunit 5 family protein [Planctomycetota bacterium]|jgi:formate hydrogenlyase subunit 3/multisubunit Na+/H+ antiporter MnhD subunit
MRIPELLLPLMVVLPLGGAFLALALSRFWSKAGRFLAELVTLVTLLISLAMAYLGVRGTLWGGTWNPLDLAHYDPYTRVLKRLFFTKIGGIALCADGLAVLMLVVIAAVSTVVAIYAASYMKSYTGRNRFYALFLLMVAGMNGCVISGDLFNFFVFLEVASIASYALVGFGTEHEELEAAFKYLVMGSLASTFFLFGVALTYGSLGTLNFAQVAIKIDAAGGLGTNPVMLLVAALFVLGLGLKAAMVPFHAWLPDAHPSAPAPISAMLSGLLIKALGVYAIARIFFQVFEAHRVEALVWVVISMGVLSMVVGVLMAVGQWDFKRLLAYHSISQMGYVVLGLGMALLLMSRIELVQGGGPIKGAPGSRKRDGLIQKAERLQKVTGLVERGEKLVSEEVHLRLEVSMLQPVLQEIEAGRMDVSRAGPEGLEGLKKRVAAINERLAVLQPGSARRRAQLEGLRREKRALAAVVGGRQASDYRAVLPQLSLALALVLLGAIFHLVNHASFKSLLFLCAGAIEKATGTRNLKELGGLWQRMPVTGATCAVGALSISGVPPFNGFWSKLMIISGAALAGHWGLAAITVLVSFLTLVSFVKVQKYALFGPMSARVLRGTREVAPSMCFSMICLAAMCFLLGVMVLWVVPGFVGPAAEALRSGAGGWSDLLVPLGIN